MRRGFFRWALNHWSILLVSAYYVANAALVSVHGEFPVNDDWIYAISVERALETGEFRLTGGIASSFFPTLVGLGVCKLVGFSYATLRCVTLVFGFLGGLALYLALLEMNVRRRDAGLWTGALILNPLFINCCFSFMTDVPALCLNNWFFLYAIKSVKNDDWKSWAWTGLFLSLSIASRQTAVIFLAPLAVAMLVLALRDRSGKRRVPAFLACIAGPAAVYAVMEPLFLRVSDFLTPYRDYKAMYLAEVASFLGSPLIKLPPLFDQFAKMTAYLGLFLVPVLVPMAAALLIGLRIRQRRPLIATAAAMALAVPGISLLALTLVRGARMPFSENLFAPPAVGTYCIISGSWPMWQESNRLGLTILACALALSLATLVYVSFNAVIVRLAGKQRDSRALTPVGPGERSRPVCSPPLAGRLMASGLLIAMFILSAAFLSFQTCMMNLDRYFLMLLAPALLVLSITYRFLSFRWMWAVSLSLLLPIAIYSSLTAMDCMGFARARWAAISWLESQGVSSTDIDGGAEYNNSRNLHLSSGYRMTESQKGWPDSWRGKPPRNGWRWWPITGEKYIIAGSTLPDYDVVTRFRYWSPLKWRAREVFILRETAGQMGSIDAPPAD